MAEEKSVEFNMSLATLERINNLIKQAHLSSQGLFSIKMNIPYSDHQVYLNTLDRIFIEVQTKMDDKERVKCLEFEKKIIETKMKWKEDILYPFIDEKRNLNYELAWNDIIFIARQYEIFLMQSMDRHKMLLREATDSGL